MRISTRLIRSYAALILIFMVLSGFVGWTLLRISETNRAADRLDSLMQLVLKMRVAERSYAGGYQRIYASQVVDALKDVQEQIGIIRVSKDLAGSVDIKELDGYVSRYDSLFTQYSAAEDQRNALKNAAFVDSKQIIDLIMTVKTAPTGISAVDANELARLVVSALNNEKGYVMAADPNDLAELKSDIGKIQKIGDRIRNSSSSLDVRLLGMKISTKASKYTQQVTAMADIQSQQIALEQQLGQQANQLVRVCRDAYNAQRTYAYEAGRLGIQMFAFAMIFSVALSAIMSWHLSKAITVPIRNLVKVTDRIATGDYKQRITELNNDEFGVLGHQVNEMAQSLETVHEELRGYSEALQQLVDERTMELREAKTQLEKANSILTEEKQRLEVVAITDALTGIYNRGYIIEQLVRMTREARRYEEHFCLMIMDIDHFKRVNDKYGHMVGDKVLKCVVDAIRNSTRETDLVGRYGGEEFIVLFPSTEIEAAAIAAERIRASVEALRFTPEAIRVTICGGLVSYSGQDEDTLLHQADDYLYQAKASGRNRIVISE